MKDRPKKKPLAKVNPFPHAPARRAEAATLRAQRLGSRTAAARICASCWGQRWHTVLAHGYAKAVTCKRCRGSGNEPKPRHSATGALNGSPDAP